MRIRTHVCRIIIHVALVNAARVMPVAAQTITFGIKVGAPIVEPFVLNDHTSDLNNYTFSTKRYTFGPTVEVSLLYHLSFEGDSLYKRLNYVSYPFGFDSFQATTSADSWEFPLLIKRYFNIGLHPYASGGLSIRHIAGGSTNFTNGEFQSTGEPWEIVARTTIGFAASGGVDLRKGPIHFQPEIRYTHWDKANFRSSNGVLGSNLNSIDVLIGVVFRKE
jgi:opacity protein-like surface antigen